MKVKKIIILGGGIAGLSAAYHLVKKGEKPIIIEKNSDLGGALISYHQFNYDIEAFYHHVFPQDSTILSIIKELGLEKEIIWKQAGTGFLYENKICSLLGIKDLLKFTPLNFKAKIGFCKLMLKIKLIKHPEKFDHMTAKEFILKHTGQTAYENLFQPLLISKFGEAAEKVSATWFIERIKLRSKTGSTGEKLGYMQGGFYKIISALEKKVTDLGGVILKNSVLEKIEIENNQIVSVIADNKKFEAKSVISSIPLKVLSSFITFSQEYQNALSKLVYQGAICITIALKKELNSKYYWMNIIKPKLSFGAVIEHTNFISKKEYLDHVLVYLGSYPDFSNPVWTLSEEEIFKKYFSDLKKIFPHISEEDIIWKKVAKASNVGLVYNTNILKNIPKIDTPLTNLFIGGMFNSYPERSINLSASLGIKMAQKSF